MPGGPSPPAHAFDRGVALFITAATLHRERHLAAPRRKDRFLAILAERCQACAVELHAWVVLDDHYHLIAHPHRPAEVSKWLASIHACNSREWNAEDGTPGRQCWYQFWDTTLWSEGDLWSRINYIHGNPIKHGYVLDPGDWCWSSDALFRAETDEEVIRAGLRFPAPRKLPNDDY